MLGLTDTIHFVEMPDLKGMTDQLTQYTSEALGHEFSKNDPAQIIQHIMQGIYADDDEAGRDFSAFDGWLL